MPRLITKMETWATTDPFVPAVMSEADFRLVVVVMGWWVVLPRMEKNEWTNNNVCLRTHGSFPLIFRSAVQHFGSILGCCFDPSTLLMWLRLGLFWCKYFIPRQQPENHLTISTRAFKLFYFCCTENRKRISFSKKKLNKQRQTAQQG